MADLQELSDALCSGYVDRVKHITKELLENGTPSGTILKEGFIAGMDIVGARMSKHEMYLPDVLQSARAMKGAMEILQPYLKESGVKATGTVVLGTVKGDMHDIGKTIVGIMLQGAGMEVIDLGVNVPPEAFIEAIRKHSPQLVGFSALLTTTMLWMKKTIDAITTAELRDKVKIMIGGAPTSQRFADEIGADGYAHDAGGAVITARELIAGLKGTEVSSHIPKVAK
ncbi:MAG TPA: corrinoid protein [Bacteroidota bacterium]